MNFLGETTTGLNADQAEVLDLLDVSEDGKLIVPALLITDPANNTEIKSEQLVVSDPLIVLGEGQLSDDRRQ